MKFVANRILLIIVGVLFVSPRAQAQGGDSKVSRDWSTPYISTSAHYLFPSTGVGGMSVDLNFGHLARFGLGVSAYVDSDTRMTGLQVAILGYLSAAAWAISLGKINFRDAYNFLNGNNGNDDMVAVLTPFADLKFFVPYWQFSPSVGLGYAQWVADPAGTRGLPAELTKDTYTYYTVGADFTGSFGYVGAGVSYAPTLPENLEISPYISLGAAFKFK